MDTEIIISIVALTISAGVFSLSRRSFFESIRPIVTAEIQTHGSGNTATLFTLAVHNVGNRPACEIRLNADKESLRAAIHEAAKEPMKKSIYNCFSENGLIAILHPGKSATNSFGASSTIENQNALRYHSRIPVEISYKDLDGEKYKSKLNLIVKDSESFAGSKWANN